MRALDEKYLMCIKKFQNSDYGNYVPFDIISRHFNTVDGTTLTVDLNKLADDGYLTYIDIPSTGFWYLFTAKGAGECNRIEQEASNKRQTFLVECFKAILIAFLTLIIERLIL